MGSYGGRVNIIIYILESSIYFNKENLFHCVGALVQSIIIISIMYREYKISQLYILRGLRSSAICNISGIISHFDFQYPKLTLGELLDTKIDICWNRISHSNWIRIIIMLGFWLFPGPFE